MPFITWTPELSVGVQEIDSQHQKLFDTINQFYAGLANPAGNKQALSQLISAVRDYTQHHFTTEENYLERFQYSDLATQKRLHREFIAKIEDVKQRFEAGKMVVSLEVTSFLKDWITSHIKVEDLKYKKCFHDHGMC